MNHLGTINRLQRGVREWDRLLEVLSRGLNDMLARMRTGTFSVYLDHRRRDPVVNRLVLGLSTSSLFLGPSLLWSLDAPPLVQGVSLFGAIGYALSLLLGIKLFRIIRRLAHSASDERRSAPGVHAKQTGKRRGFDSVRMRLGLAGRRALSRH